MKSYHFFNEEFLVLPESFVLPTKAGIHKFQLT